MFINRIIRWFNGWPDLLKFLVLIAVTVYATYYAPAPVAVAWYAVMAVAYFFSTNEALWLALFLATADGFASYFGMYEVTLHCPARSSCSGNIADIYKSYCDQGGGEEAEAGALLQ